jgi:KTSC domain-containing protein
MSDLDLFFAKTGASPDAAEAASAGSFPIPLPLKTSSCVASATYSPFDGILQITFNDGGEAHYTVGLITILKWFDAKSVGGFFNSEIKGR